jgi:hypothetical protein
MLLDDAPLSATEAKPLIRWLILILTGFRTVGTVKAVGYYCSLRNFGNFAYVNFNECSGDLSIYVQPS